MHQIIENWIHTWFTWVQSGGYPMIILLMAMESSVIPVPSEIVMPPAAFMAAQGKLNLWLVILGLRAPWAPTLARPSCISFHVMWAVP